MGIVYVVTNAAMPGLVKIGRTSQTIEKRLRALDGTGVPVPFECVAAWEFPDEVNTEKVIHQAFADRRVRKSREFFRVSPNQPIAILEGFGTRDVTPQDDVVDEKNAADDQASLAEARSRRENFRFDVVDIRPGDTLTSVWDESVTCTVVDKRKVRFGDKTLSMSAAALKVLHSKGKNWKSVSGPESWQFDGKTLAAIRDEGEPVTRQDDIDDETNTVDDQASPTNAKSKSKRGKFRFDMVGIKPGDTLTSVRDKSVTCTVVDNQRVRFGNETISLSAAALKVLRNEGKNWSSVSGPESWQFRNKTLARMRDEKEQS